MSFRDFMNAPQKPSDFGTCRLCKQPIEKRGAIWYTIGQTIASDICVRSRHGGHIKAPGS